MYMLITFLFGCAALVAMVIATRLYLNSSSGIVSFKSILFGFGGVTLMFLVIIIAVVNARGTPKPELALDNHAIYEVLSVTELSDGSYAVWLREQDGDEHVYQMKVPPPQPRFQVAGNGANRQYLPYPSTDSTDSP